MSIFDEPKENILVKSYANIKNNLIIESDSDSSTTISEEVIGLSSLQTFEFNNSNSSKQLFNAIKELQHLFFIKHYLIKKICIIYSYF